MCEQDIVWTNTNPISSEHFVKHMYCSQCTVLLASAKPRLIHQIALQRTHLSMNVQNNVSDAYLATETPPERKVDSITATFDGVMGAL